MSPVILEESQFMLHAVLMGVIITFGYDVFRLLRRVIPHGNLLVSIEDLLFWVLCSIGIFYLFYTENNGSFRWFAILGAAAGMFGYRKTLSGLFVEGGAKLLLAVFSLIGKIWRVLSAPARKIRRWQRRKTAVWKKKAAGRMRLAKKQLTVQLKLVKMTLCKRLVKQQKAGDKKNGKKKTGIS